MSQKRRILFTDDARLTFAEAKPAADGTPPANIATLTGYALVWGAISTDRGGYAVRLAASSANFASNVHALIEHDYCGLLGDTVSNTLRISSDAVGVKVEIDLPNTTTGRDTLELVKTRRLRGFSFSMVDGVEEGEPTREAGQAILTAKRYTVDEITLTCRPAFPAATVEVSAAPPGDGEDAYSDTRRQAMRFMQSRHAMQAPE